MMEADAITPIDAVNRLFDISTAFCQSQAFFTACRLGVFDALGEQPATAEEVARRLGLHPLGCRRLLAALTGLGLIEAGHDGFRNSALGSFCTSSSSVPLEPFSMWGWGTPFYHMWEFLPDAVRELSPRWQQALGTTAQEVFAALYEDPARLRRFTQFLQAFSGPQGRVIAELVDFSRYRCVLDVAGGPGSIAIEIGLKHRHLRGLVMDLAPVCAIANEHIQSSGLGDRFTAVVGDLFAGPYPSGADVIVLASILHDWDDADGRTILRRCFEALPSQGLLLVVEKVLEDDLGGPPVGLMMDLHMLLVSAAGARERNEAEYRALLEAAGFGNVETQRLDAPRDLVIARKP